MDITYLKGVGPKRAELYRKLGIETAEQLIELYPRDYVDLTAPVTVAQAHIGEVCAFRAFVMSKKSPFNEYARMALYKAVTDRRYSQIWQRVRSAMVCTSGKCLPEIAPQGHFLALRTQGATSAVGLLAMTNLWLLPF